METVALKLKLSDYQKLLQHPLATKEAKAEIASLHVQVRALQTEYHAMARQFHKEFKVAN